MYFVSINQKTLPRNKLPRITKSRKNVVEEFLGRPSTIVKKPSNEIMKTALTKTHFRNVFNV